MLTVPSSSNSSRGSRLAVRHAAPESFESLIAFWNEAESKRKNAYQIKGMSDASYSMALIVAVDTCLSVLRVVSLCSLFLFWLCHSVEEDDENTES
jgi:hypothetical protein